MTQPRIEGNDLHVNSAQFPTLASIKQFVDQYPQYQEIDISPDLVTLAHRECFQIKLVTGKDPGSLQAIFKRFIRVKGAIEQTVMRMFPYFEECGPPLGTGSFRRIPDSRLAQIIADCKRFEMMIEAFVQKSVNEKADPDLVKLWVMQLVTFGRILTFEEHESKAYGLMGSPFVHKDHRGKLDAMMKRITE